MENWRNDPATEAQKGRLKSEGKAFSPTITKGEASDLIGSTLKPHEDEIAILRFFNVTGVSDLSQTDARKEIAQIFASRGNKERWESRPADKVQKDVYRFFKVPIPSGLTHRDAEDQIQKLFDDEQQLEAWSKQQEEIDDRNAWFEDTRELMNDSCYLYDCKKVGKKLFKEVAESLESSGMSFKEIEENEEIFFKKALELNPALRRR